MKVRFPFRYMQEATIGCLPLVSHLQGLPRLYDDPKSQSLFSVYRTHDKQGLCAARASKSPPFLVNSSQASGVRAHIWDPRYQTACMQAGKGPSTVVHASRSGPLCSKRRECCTQVTLTAALSGLSSYRLVWAYTLNGLHATIHAATPWAMAHGHGAWATSSGAAHNCT